MGVKHRIHILSTLYTDDMTMPEPHKEIHS